MTSEPALLSDPSTGSLVLLERYRVTGRIAAGSAGLVLAAIDLRGGEPVAIKCFYGGHDSYETWLDEARLVMRLRHPNIVAVLDVGHDERTDLDVIVYARAHGGSLRRALVERGRLRREETRAVLQSVATALVHAHTQGVIHRDIKPENILAMDAADGGSWALTDFGAGRFLAPGSGGGSFAGSPGYHAPELLHGQLGPSSDQYSLGVVGVELLIGERPDHAACLDFAWTHRRARGLEGLLARMVSVDPARRLPSLEAVVEALGASEAAPLDVTADGDGRRFALVDNGLFVYEREAKSATGRCLIPRARGFCSLRGQSLVIAGERRLVTSRDRARVLYVAERPFDTLAVSVERGVAWVRRGQRIALLELTSLREWSDALPDEAADALAIDAPRIGYVIEHSHALIGLVGCSRVVWCARRGDRLRVTTFDVCAPVYDGFIGASGPLLLCGGPSDAVLFAPSIDGLSELDRRKASVASVLVDDSGAGARLIPDALSQAHALAELRRTTRRSS